MEINLTNLGTINKNKITIMRREYGSTQLYFSYETLVAVNGSEGLKVAINEWSKTTQKFLNELEPDHSQRVPHLEIQEYAQREFKRLGV